MNCIKHNNVPAQGFCVSCGKPYCKDCLINYGGEYRCRYCLSYAEPTNEYLVELQKPVSTLKSEKKTVNKNSSTTRPILFIIAIILIIAVAISSNDGASDSVKPGYSEDYYNKMQALAEQEYENQAKEENPTPEPIHDSMNGFEVQDLKAQSDKYSRYVTGKILNNKGYKLRYMQITINLYDKNENIVGTAWDNVVNVEPGETWSFKAGVYADNAKSIRVTEIIGY